MSLFERIEQACASFIERTFARTFPSDLEPSQIARKLVATVEARTRDDDGRLSAPGAYAVYVNPGDYLRLEPHRAYLEREWAELVRELSGKVGIELTGPPKVRLHPRESVPSGAVDVAVEGRGAAGRAHWVLRTVRGVPPDGVYSMAGTVRLGRGDDNDIVLADPSVSRDHAAIEIRGRSVVVSDAESTNGTFVNGRRIDRSALAPGDELTLGNTRLRLELDES